MAVLNAHADKTGRRMMHAFNVAGELDDMRRSIDLIAKAGGTCAMVSLNWVGGVALKALRRDCPVAIHGNRNGWGMLERTDRAASGGDLPGIGAGCTALREAAMSGLPLAAAAAQQPPVGAGHRNIFGKDQADRALALFPGDPRSEAWVF
jgi:ribulose 1,5-bisphosphate carboxylase large subunit-like protein